MRSIDVYSFYNLAVELAAIRSLAEETTAWDIAIINMRVGHVLRAVLSGEMVELGVARGPARELQRVLEELNKKYFTRDGEWHPPEEGVRVPQWELAGLKEALQRFEHVLAAETKISAVYHATKKGIFNTQDLVEAGDKSFPERLRPFIPEQCLLEYKSAGRALAFDLPTAAAFHVARAVESMLRDYRSCFLPGKSGPTMGATVKTLVKHAQAELTPRPHSKTLRQLEQFVHLDRNRIMHPEDVLTVDQAIICFYNGIAAVTAMAAEVQELRPQPEQGVLPLGVPVPVADSESQVA